ncbi:MAG: dihydropteroate synthase [Rhodothermales bacterium]|nr:dihydropteroate synthase [Rhodothermales bacterium]
MYFAAHHVKKTGSHVRTEATATHILNCRGRPLSCRGGRGESAIVMGILNVTPDSFSDGGKFMRLDNALHRVEEMLNEGAAIVDVGGESSRPTGRSYGEGARPITDDEEIRRVAPVIESIVSRFPEVFVSIDTYKPAVARAAVDAGAHLINDITGLRYNQETAAVAANAEIPLIVMHSVGTPGALPHEVEHEDVVDTVRSSLSLSMERAQAAGVADVVLDPGFGFGKSVSDNLRILKQIGRFTELGGPVMVGISRKSTVGRLLEQNGIPAPVAERLYGTLAATVIAVLNGASIVRTHDVAPTVDVLRVTAAVADA